MRIGLQEIFLCVIAYICLFKSEDVPQYAKKISDFTKKIKELRREAESVVTPAKEVVQPLQELKEEVSSAVSDMKNIGNEHKEED